MKILVYGINYAPDLVGIAKYTTEMCQFLSRAGHDVCVVTAPPYYPAWQVTKPYKSYAYKHDAVDGIPVTRCPIYVPKTQGALKRIIHHLSFAIASGPAIIAKAVQFRPDVVLTIAPSLLTAPGAVAAAKLSGARTWLHIQDFEVDAAFDLGFVSGSRFKRFALWIERIFLSMFDTVSTISPKMLELLRSKGVPAVRCVEFRSWVNSDVIRPLPSSAALRASFNIAANATVALYSGSIGTKQGMEYLVAAAERLVTRRPDIVFVICGTGSLKDELRTTTRHLPNVMLLDLQPFDIFAKLLSEADIQLLPQRPEILDLVLPAKVSALLASGRPIVAMAREGTQLKTELDGVGIITPPGDVDAFTEALVRLADDPELRVRLGASGRELALRRWDHVAVLGRIETKLQELCSRSIARAYNGLQPAASHDRQVRLAETPEPKT